MGKEEGRIVVVGPEEFDGTVAEQLARALGDPDRGARITLSLAGGATPRGGYQRLGSLQGLPWERVEVYFGDERAVPPHHPESNYHMAWEALLSRVPVSRERVHRMEAEDPDLEAAARRYEEALPEALEILVLGIGEDGHTASLFPGGDPVRESLRRVVPSRGPRPPRERLTITPPVLLAAREILVLARGGGKADAVRRALEGPLDPHRCPAQLARRGTWILDEGAAGGLGMQKDGERP